MPPSPPDPAILLPRIIAMQRRLRDHLRSHMRTQGRQMAQVSEHRAGDGDTIYHIDESAEDVILEECEAWGRETPFILVAEGVPGNGWQSFPPDADLEDAAFFLIVDPIDGTREIMYDKRSAWTLTAIAPNKGPQTSIADITLAVQTELPTTRHLYGDTLWAVKGCGASGERQNLATNQVEPLSPRPSDATTIAHGFAGIVKFFPGSKVPAAQMEENLFDAVLGDPADGHPLVFDDQYISTGGQIYELAVGHYRFVADLRPVYTGGTPALMCCHPYDICTELIAREAGCIITNERGRGVSAPLDIRASVSWIGYANQHIHAQVAPSLHRLLAGYIKPE